CDIAKTGGNAGCAGLAGRAKAVGGGRATRECGPATGGSGSASGKGSSTRCHGADSRCTRRDHATGGKKTTFADE
ncbi:hypothetical protein QR504_25825, partial [Escherichia coli]|uniref:hypothetical protein n=1 Tax=Escherichia coli TaxID=562 RepID=UPI0027393162